MNRNTRIFLYGLALIGLGILLIRVGDEPLGLIFAVVGLFIGTVGAFRHDPKGRAPSKLSTPVL